MQTLHLLLGWGGMRGEMPGVKSGMAHRFAFACFARCWVGISERVFLGVHVKKIGAVGCV